MNIRLFTTVLALVASFFLLSPSPVLAARAQETLSVPEGQPPYVPKPLPSIIFKDEKDRPVDIERFKGQVVVLNFWATWCAPCVEEMPSLNNLQKKYGNEGLKVIAVSEDDTIQKVFAFFKEKNIRHLEVFMDDKGFSYGNLGLSGLPQTILIDHAGKEAIRIPGFLDWESDNARIVLEDLLKRRKSALEKE